MSLPIPARIGLKKAIQLEVEELIKQKVKPSSQAKNKWHFKNASDWHYGHYVGVSLMNSSNAFEKMFGSRPSIEQTKEIEELIEEYSKDLQKYFQSFDKE